MARTNTISIRTECAGCKVYNAYQASETDALLKTLNAKVVNSSDKDFVVEFPDVISLMKFERAASKINLILDDA